MSTRAQIYDVVRRIPRGCVSTYGGVARQAGLQGGARQVGYALAALGHDTELPWHRVINAKGSVSPRRGSYGSETLQRILLEAEGVVFSRDGRVDLDFYGWP